MANISYFFTSRMPNAPTLNNNAGSLISLLKSCLVDGFGSQTITNFTVSNGLATVSITNTSANFQKNQIVKISGNVGAYASTINAKFRVTLITSTFLNFAISIPDGTYYTAGMTCMVAPIGWNMPFGTSGNIGVFRSSDTTGTQYYLRVDDTIGGYAGLQGFSSMTDVNCGGDCVPSKGIDPSIFSNGSPNNTVAASHKYSAIWRKYYSNNTSTAVQWVIVGDGKTFYYGTSVGSVLITSIEWYVAGDINSSSNTDPNAFIISSCCAGSASITTSAVGSVLFSNNSNGLGTPWSFIFLAKNYAGNLISPQAVINGDAFNSSNQAEPFGSLGVNYPNAPNSALLLRDHIEVYELSGNYASLTYHKRGYLRGVLQVKHNRPLSAFDTFVLPNGDTGVCLPYNDNIGSGTIAFNISGNW